VENSTAKKEKREDNYQMANDMRGWRRYPLNGAKAAQRLQAKGEAIGICSECRGVVVKDHAGREVCTGCGLAYNEHPTVP